MKKHLQKVFLLALFVLISGNQVKAQFSITSTSISFTGNTVPNGSNPGVFYSYQPNNSGGTMYADNTCSTPITQGGGANEVGGFDPNIYDATSVTPAHPAGVIFYGGKLRTVYYGSPCEANIPSFGFHTGTTGIGTGSNVDLSATSNQKIQFSYRSDASITFNLQLLDEFYNPKLTGAAVSLIGDNSPHTVTIDFSSNLLGGADLTNVRQVSFEYASTTLSPNFGISLANIKVGSAVTSNKSAVSNISSSKIFPNPSNGSANVELNLKSVSDVKVTLTDLMGKEVAVIANERTESLNKPFSTSDLTQGVYTVNYFINGTPAKSELLMVK